MIDLGREADDMRRCGGLIADGRDISLWLSVALSAGTWAWLTVVKR
jgi:hypothetical protein